MGIFERFSNVLKANLNSLLDHLEDPKKLIDQAIIDLEDKKRNIRRLIAEAKAELDLLDPKNNEIEAKKTKLDSVINSLSILDEKIQSLKNQAAKTILSKNDSFETFDRMKEKVIRMEDEAKAMEELMNKDKDTITSQISDIEQELENLKKKLK